MVPKIRDIAKALWVLIMMQLYDPWSIYWRSYNLREIYLKTTGVVTDKSLVELWQEFQGRQERIHIDCRVTGWWVCSTCCLLYTATVSLGTPGATRITSFLQRCTGGDSDNFISAALRCIYSLTRRGLTSVAYTFQSYSVIVWAKNHYAECIAD